MTDFHEQQARMTTNRERFKDQMEKKAQKSRFGLFSQPLPLTVGDSSTNYQKNRIERSEVGKVKNIVNNPGRGCLDTFEKLKSNAIGDAFVDPGQYFLRKNEDLKSQDKVFKPSGCNKTVRNSEFQHLHNGPPMRTEPEKNKNFLARSTLDSFQQKIYYKEDLYENKEDMIRNDYISRRNQILSLERPYTSTVKQRGTFYAHRTTFGSDRDFPQKPKPQKRPPSYGPFKAADPPHKGYNKTIGKNWPYVEDPEQDPIMYQKNVKNPIWKDPSHGQTCPIQTIHDYFRNSSRENQFVSRGK